MSKKKYLFIILLIIAILSNIYIVGRESIYPDANCTLYYTICADKPGNYQLFYSEEFSFDEKQSFSQQYNKKEIEQTLSFDLPVTTNYIRLDLNQCPTVVQLSDIHIKFYRNNYELNLERFLNALSVSMVEEFTIRDNVIEIRATGEDAFVVLDISDLKLSQRANDYNAKINLAKNILLCVILDFILFYLYRYSSKLKRFFLELYQNRELVFRLSKNDFMVKYAGSYFGIVWAFIQPTITILLYWFVFQMGFRSGSVGDTPFVLWLIAGMIPWFYFQEAVFSGSNCLIEYSYLVKKVVFNVSVLPIVKTLSALFVHLFFICIMLIIFIAYGYYPDIYTLQIFYYLICMFVLSLGLAYLGSALIIFFRDLGQIINILLQVGMWMTPIMWQYIMLPEKFRILLKLNPIYYIITGYRDSLIDKVAFWAHDTWTIYFWFVTMAILIVSMKLFNRLKVHFADVL